MRNTLEYKGYLGSIEYSPEDGVLIGEMLGISDSASYHGSSVEEVRVAFTETVDDYLDLCAEIGKKPETPYNGNLAGIEICPTLHRQIFAVSLNQRKTPAQFIEEAVSSFIAQKA